MDDETRKLISRARDKDAAATEELFSRYRDRLHQAIGRLLGPRYRAAIADSEDAVHDAILASFGRLESFDYNGEGSFLAWLLRSADFQIRMRLRELSTQKRGGNRVRSLEDDPGAGVVTMGDTPSEKAADREDEERLMACLDRLPPREREIIMLRRYLALDNDEICEELSLPSPGAARALLSRAQARLAAMLSQDDAT